MVRRADQRLQSSSRGGRGQQQQLMEAGGAAGGRCLTVVLPLPPAGTWIKPSRTSRMKEKRADFVAGWLGGRIVAAGGLGQHTHSSASGIRIAS